MYARLFSRMNPLRVAAEILLSAGLSKNDGPTAEEVRERLRGMTDDQLLQFGRAANFMCSARANMNHSPRQPFVIQLQEARGEWKRRRDGTSETLS